MHYKTIAIELFQVSSTIILLTRKFILTVPGPKQELPMPMPDVVPLLLVNSSAGDVGLQLP